MGEINESSLAYIVNIKTLCPVQICKNVQHTIYIIINVKV